MYSNVLPMCENPLKIVLKCTLMYRIASILKARFALRTWLGMSLFFKGFRAFLFAYGKILGKFS